MKKKSVEIKEETVVVLEVKCVICGFKKDTGPCSDFPVCPKCGNIMVSTGKAKTVNKLRG